MRITKSQIETRFSYSWDEPVQLKLKIVGTPEECRKLANTIANIVSEEALGKT